MEYALYIEVTLLINQLGVTFRLLERRLFCNSLKNPLVLWDRGERKGWGIGTSLHTCPRK